MSENKKEMNPQFSEALKHALVAGLPAALGAIFGGSQGLASGAQTGAQLSMRLSDDQLKKQQQDAAVKAEMEALQAQQGFQASESSKQQRHELKMLGIKNAADVGTVEKTAKGAEAKAIQAADLAQLADNDYEAAVKEGFSPSSSENVWAELSSYVLPAGLEGVTQSPLVEKARQAENAFLSKTLRDDSGAVISDSDLEVQRAIYFPRVGENNPGTITAKKVARANLITALKQKGGVLTLSEAKSQYSANKFKGMSREDKIKRLSEGKY